MAGADEGMGYDFDCSLGAPITVHGHVPATVEQGADLPLEDVFLEYTNPVGPVTYAGTRLSIPAARGTAGPDHVIALPGEVAIGEGETYRSAPTSGAFRVTAEPGTVLELRPADLFVKSASTVGGGRLACTFPGGQPAFARTTVVAPSGGASPGGLGAFPSAHAFVDQQHRDLLRRPPTATQLDRWVARLRDGMAPTRVVRKLMAAPRSAGVVAPIVRLYLVGFGLRPDYGALGTWTSRVRAGLPLSVVASAVTVSENPAAAGALSP
ncbi:MAG: hypothetical protein H0U89_01005, partial [Acidimicrobiia bacterium]|nr:hypothetical protein [Acidimicrobiia bacterium]